MSVASSDTLSDSHEFQLDNIVPLDILEQIIARTIGASIYECVTGITPYKHMQSMIEELFSKFWKPMVNLMAVSSQFRGITTDLLCKSFGARLSTPNELPLRGFLCRRIHDQLRSLILFTRATMGRAIANPPPFALNGAPLLEACGYFVIARARVDQSTSSAPYSRCQSSELSKAFRFYCRCVASQELVEDLELAFEQIEAKKPGLLD